MAVLPILCWPDPRLEERCLPVSGDISGLIADMLETMYAAPGRGLAAPQVGQLLRLFVMDVSWKESAPTPMAFINPVILWRSSDRVIGPEGCLSIPGVTAQVARAREIRLRYTDATGALKEDHLTGMAAICAQHEYDHLDGILTLDRIPPAERHMAEASLI